MKAKFFTLFIAALFGFNAMSSAQTNYLNQLYFGAENALATPVADNAWYFPEVPANSGNFYYSFSTDHKTLTTDQYSVKFSATDATVFGTYATTIVAGSTAPDAAKITLAAGSYVLKFKAYLGDNCPGAIQFWIQPGTSTTNVCAFKLGGLGALGKNQWLELTAVDNGTNTTPTVLATALSGGKMSINIPKTQITGATASTPSVMYIDDISIYTYEAPNAVKQIQAVDCKVFANSSTNELNVESPVGSNVRVYNTVGSLVKTVQNINGTVVMPTSSMSKGIYLVEVSYNGNKTVNKVSL